MTRREGTAEPRPAFAPLPPAPRRSADDVAASAGPSGPEPVLPALSVVFTCLALTARAAGSGAYTFTLSGSDALAVGASGTGAYLTSPVLSARLIVDEFSVDGVVVPGGLEERITGGVLHLRSGLFGPEPEWTSIPLGSAAQALERTLARAGQVDADTRLRLLLAADGIALAGSEEIGGVATVRYSGNLTRDQLAACPDLPAVAGGIGEVGIDVWVDETNRVRRIATCGPTPAGEIRMDVTFTA